MKRVINNYTSPSPDDLSKLKEQLDFTGNEMADLALVAGNSQWRKYTGGHAPRNMSAHILFTIAAQLTLNEEEINKIIKKMKDIGADIS